MRTGRWIALLGACMAAAGAASLWVGQDANWDLRNYHYYNPFAFLHERHSRDVVPAQLQSFHNPLADLPFYALVNGVESARVVSVAMALPAAIAAFFLARIALLLFPAGSGADRAILAGASVAVAVTGSTGIAVIGSTMNEWHCAAFLMPAIYLVLAAFARADESGSPFLWAGVLAGFAAGLKLTYGVFALALFVAVATSGFSRASLWRSLAAGIGLAAGFALAYGHWGIFLWREFANPFFPYFNGFFRSPWFEARSFYDERFGPRSVLEALVFPWIFARQSTTVSEVGFRDYRLAVAMTLGAIVLVQWALARARDRRIELIGMPARSWIFVVVFAVVAYVSWLRIYSIYRYLVPLELLAGPLIVGGIAHLCKPAMVRRLAVLALSALVIGTTVPPGWGRIPFGERFFEVVAPPLEPGAMVVLTHDEPTAYAIPFFQRDARFVHPSTNVFYLGQENLMVRRAQALIRAHQGPLYALQYRGPRHARTSQVLYHFGLSVDSASCQVVRSNLDSDAIEVCRLRRNASRAQ